MGTYDRYEKLGMFGDIDEKYIKEADKYLTQPLAAGVSADITPDSAISLSPQPKKLSWKSFAVLAACAAVLIGGTAVLANYLNNRTVSPPVFGTSDSSDDSDSSNEIDNSRDDNSNVIDRYLENTRKQYNVSDDIKISYLKDGWEWTKFEVGGNDDGFYGPMITSRLQNGSAFLDERTMLTVRTLEDGNQEIAAYDLFDKKFTTIFGKDNEPPENLDGTKFEYALCHADNNTIVFTANISRGATNSKHELRVINTSDLSRFTVPFVEQPTIMLLGANNMLIEDNDLYFILYNGNPADGVLYRYDLSQKGEGAAERLRDSACHVYSVNGEVFYSIFDGVFNGGEMQGTEYLHTLGGNLPTDNMNAQTLRAVKNAGFFDTGSHRVTNITTGKTLFTLPDDARFDAVSDSCITFGNVYSAEPDYFLFDAENNELFVYKDSGLNVNSTDWQWHKCGEGFCVFDEGVNTSSSGYILKRKTSKPDETQDDNSNAIDPDFLKNIRTVYNVKDDIKISYLKDGWEWTEFEAGGKEHGFDAWEMRAWLDNGAAIIDENTLLAVRELNDGSKEIASYNIADNMFKTIFGKEDKALEDGMTAYYTLLYTNGEFLVFGAQIDKNDVMQKNELRILNLNYGSNSVPWKMRTIPIQNVGMIRKGLLIEDNVLYYITNYSLADGRLYRYDLLGADGSAPELINDKTFQVYSVKGEIVYSSLVIENLDDDVSTLGYHKLNGDTLVDGNKYNDVLAVKNAGLFNTASGTVTNCETNEVLFALNNAEKAVATSDSCIAFREYRNSFDDRPQHFFFDAENNELYVYFDSGMDVEGATPKWYKWSKGFCVFDGNTGKGYIIKRKAN